MTMSNGSTRLIGLETLREKLGGPDPASVYRWIADGLLPRPIKIGRRASRWIEAEVDAAIQGRADARDRSGPGGAHAVAPKTVTAPDGAGRPAHK